ncbi:Phytoene synthase [Bombardia bombarda]|uniref:Bifunctional lycopene cyclase/phytoene synthase n=1 Tax=Bombardia bombarda TaxID=252184 RepID=A0AA40C887_9PEZI|nr:Phytoene synthase [Bombardia bombarda]
MAYEYALVHAKFTIPFALLLTLIAYPILTRIHLVQISCLIFVAFSATLPWDAYLIASNVWTYPHDAILGPRLLGIPLEELFFFVIQTYITSLVYILCNKPLLHSLYLVSQKSPKRWIRMGKLAGQILLASITLLGAHLVQRGGPGTYLGLILAWAPPFALLTWTVAGRFILSLPWFATALPILLPTVYLWLVDELALGRGTWSIESGTKLGLRLFGALEIEEAAFFLATNTLIVFGMATFDQYLAVIYSFPHIFPEVPRTPTPLMLVESRLLGSSAYDFDRLDGLRDAVKVLQQKSRSFYLASSLFSGRLRINLTLLYSFCRIADDLADSTPTKSDVLAWTAKLTHLLDLFYHGLPSVCLLDAPPPARPSPPLGPLRLLIKGFETDAQFAPQGSDNIKQKQQQQQQQFPIATEQDLLDYAECVAGTVGELCVALIVHHCDPHMSAARRQHLCAAACRMGIALQYVNVARDIVVDAAIGRVYLPTAWLAEEGGMTPADVIARPEGPAIDRLRRRLLDRAFEMYDEARPSMEGIPGEGRGPMVAAVETYMEIGRVLREGGERVVRREGKNRDRATVPGGRRVWTAVRGLYGQ